MSQARCPNCFAPAVTGARACEYCGTPYPQAAAPAHAPPAPRAAPPPVRPAPRAPPPPPSGGGLAGFFSKAVSAIEAVSNGMDVVDAGLSVLGVLAGGDFQRIVHPRGHQVVTGACRRDRPDPRDIIYDRHNEVSPGDLPAHVDLREHFTPVEDQGHLGSCTANAIAGAYEYLHKRITGDDVNLSRLFIYYLERDLEGSVNKDSGAALRDGIKVLRQYGVCREDLWPYDIQAFRERPPDHAFNQASEHTIDEYHRVPVELHAMKACLAEGYPFVFGLELYQSFQKSGRHGRIPMPRSGERNLGGHAMVCCGYSERDQVFLVRNSWGEDWGDSGYCYVPYQYLADSQYTTDCWTLRRSHDLDFTPVDGGADKSFFGPEYYAAEDALDDSGDGVATDGGDEVDDSSQDGSDDGAATDADAVDDGAQADSDDATDDTADDGSDDAADDTTDDTTADDDAAADDTEDDDTADDGSDDDSDDDS